MFSYRKLQFSAAASLLSATFDNCNNAMPQAAMDARGSSSSAKVEDVPIDIVIVPNALCLSQIEEHPVLKLMLKDMENQAAAIARKIERKETRTFVVKNEIYQLLTFFVVFQGVVLTAVAQASTLKCRHWWAPFTLSLIASAMTFVGVYQKLETFRQVKDDFENERFNFSVNGLNFFLSSVLCLKVCCMYQRCRKHDSGFLVFKLLVNGLNFSFYFIV